MAKLSQPFSNKTATDWIACFEQAASAEERLQALQAIGLQLPPEESGRWAFRALGDVDSTVRALGAKLLGATRTPLPEDDNDRLSSLLSDADPDVRFESARALERRKSPQAIAGVPVLLAFLDEDETHPLMIAAVIRVLAGIEMPPEAAEQQLSSRLRRFVDHERGEVRESVAIAFAEWPSICRPFAESLIPLLDDSEPVVREKIAETLGRTELGSEPIKVALEHATADEDTEVARTAIEALQRLASIRSH